MLLSCPRQPPSFNSKTSGLHGVITGLVKRSAIKSQNNRMSLSSFPLSQRGANGGLLLCRSLNWVETNRSAHHAAPVRGNFKHRAAQTVILRVCGNFHTVISYCIKYWFVHLSYILSAGWLLKGILGNLTDKPGVGTAGWHLTEYLKRGYWLKTSSTAH